MPEVPSIDTFKRKIALVKRMESVRSDRILRRYCEFFISSRIASAANVFRCSIGKCDPCSVLLSAMDLQWERRIIVSHL